MLHSLQYYACCYALLCLMHQQQRAASLTIIIDGATTNEWATQDEYKRMLEATSQLDLALSQQQQQQQQDQLDYQQELDQPPPAPPLPLKQLYERASTKQHYCGKNLVQTLELVCHGRYYGGEGSEPKIVEPTIKTKRNSRSRALSSSPASSSTSLQQHLTQQQQPLSSSSTASKLLKHRLAPIHQEAEDVSYPAAGNRLNADERNRLREIQMQLQAAHLGDGSPEAAAAATAVAVAEEAQHNRRETIGTENTNDGDTSDIMNTDNINPLANNNNNNNKARNRYNRMILSRRVRGVTEECCKRPCELEVLESYCAV